MATPVFIVECSGFCLTAWCASAAACLLLQSACLSEWVANGGLVVFRMMADWLVVVLSDLVAAGV